MYENSYKEKGKEKQKPSEINQSIVTLTGTTGQRVLKNIFCGSYFRMFLVLHPRIFQISLIIRYCNQLSGYFISSKFNFNFIKMMWHTFVFSAIVSTKQLLANFMRQKQYKSFHFLSKMLCFIMLVYPGR